MLGKEIGFTDYRMPLFIIAVKMDCFKIFAYFYTVSCKTYFYFYQHHFNQFCLELNAKRAK